MDDFRGPDKNFRRKTLNYQDNPDNISVLTPPDSMTIHKGERDMEREEAKDIDGDYVIDDDNVNVGGTDNKLRKRKTVHGVNTDKIAGNDHLCVYLSIYLTCDRGVNKPFFHFNMNFHYTIRWSRAHRGRREY